MKVIVEQNYQWLFLSILLLILFFILAFFVSLYDYFVLDLMVSKAVQGVHLLFYTLLMKTVSRLGDFSFASFSILSCGVVLVLKDKVKEAFFLILSSLGAVGLGGIIKLLILRPRPSADLVYIYDQSTSYSFPSGHVMFFIGFYGFWIYLLSQQHNLKPTLLTRSLMVGLALLIISIGFSRVYLGAHWFSDVLGGYLLGLAWLALIIYFYQETT